MAEREREKDTQKKKKTKYKREIPFRSCFVFSSPNLKQTSFNQIEAIGNRIIKTLSA
jgi:hypothetical protein